jgi:hypothetical protein
MLVVDTLAMVKAPRPKDANAYDAVISVGLGGDAAWVARCGGACQAGEPRALAAAVIGPAKCPHYRFFDDAASPTSIITR